MKPARSLMLSALAAGAAALATPAAADDAPIQLIIQNNMPVPVYTDTEGGASQCLRGLPGTTIPAHGTVYVTMWLTCDQMMGEQVFIPATSGPEARTNLDFGYNAERDPPLLGGHGDSPTLSISLSGFRREGNPVLPGPGSLLPPTYDTKLLAWKWTIDCPAAGCPKP